MHNLVKWRIYGRAQLVLLFINYIQEIATIALLVYEYIILGTFTIATVH